MQYSGTAHNKKYKKRQKEYKYYEYYYVKFCVTHCLCNINKILSEMVHRIIQTINELYKSNASFSQSQSQSG